MELVFVSDPIAEVAKFFGDKYFGCKVLTVCGDEYAEALERVGVRVEAYSEGEADEDVRCVFCAGRRADTELAKSLARGRKLVVATGELYPGLFDDFCILDYKISKLGSPECVFVDIARNYGALQASAVSLAVGVYAEALGLCGSGLRNGAWKVARDVANDMRSLLGSGADTQELIAKVAERIGKLNAVSGGFFRMAEALYPAEEDVYPAHSRFFLYFTAIFAAIRFTKCDFCVILPEKDRVRTRILCDALGLRRPDRAPTMYDAEACLQEAKDFLAEEAELERWRRRFMLTAGSGTAITEVLLDNLSLAAELTDEVNLYTVLAANGYIDAIAQGAG